METSHRLERLELIATEETLASLGVSTEDLADPDVRSVVIRAEHPELDRALQEGMEEIVLDGVPMSVRLHLTMHEVVGTQLADDDPPEVYLTARRLVAAGYERHEVLHMLAAPMTAQIHAALRENREYDRSRHLAALADLPASWERQRAQRKLVPGDPTGRHAGRRRRRR